MSPKVRVPPPSLLAYAPSVSPSLGVLKHRDSRRSYPQSRNQRECTYRARQSLWLLLRSDKPVVHRHQEHSRYEPSQPITIVRSASTSRSKGSSESKKASQLAKTRFVASSNQGNGCRCHGKHQEQESHWHQRCYDDHPFLPYKPSRIYWQR